MSETFKAFDLVVVGAEIVGRIKVVNADGVVVKAHDRTEWGGSVEHIRKAPTWVSAAWQFGGEVVANEGRRFNPNRDERDDIASLHPAKSWDEMSKEDRDLAVAAFVGGVNSEIAAQRRS